MKTNFTCTTDGSGIWTTRSGSTTVTKLEIDDQYEHNPCLKAFVSGWDITFNLIYTDKHWIQDFRRHLVDTLGFSQEAADTVRYSEHGAQEPDCVHLAVGDEFMHEWNAMHLG